MNGAHISSVDINKASFSMIYNIDKAMNIQRYLKGARARCKYTYTRTVRTLLN